MKKVWNQDLSGMNTFRMKVSCRCFVEYASVPELSEILFGTGLPRPLFPIGGGSNLLFTGDFPGTVLHCGMQGIRPLGSGLFHADAGLAWDAFCAWCASEGLWGPENLSHIPGEVGAAAVQNIGAYGREAGELIEYVSCVDALDGSLVDIPASDCAYAYRESRFKHDWKGRYIVTGVVFRLSRQPSPELGYGHVREAVLERFGSDDPALLTPSMVRRTVTDIRKGKLPDVDSVGSAGSFFRNPSLDSEGFAAVVAVAGREGLGPVPHFDAGGGRVKVPAAWMIERCGWKGRKLGGAGVYEGQPLVLVNLSGEATPREIMDLAEGIRASVREKFGVSLEKEVEFV